MSGKSVLSAFCAVSFTLNNDEGHVKNVMFTIPSNRWPMCSEDLIALNTYIFMELNVPISDFVLLSAIPIEDFI